MTVEAQLAEIRKNKADIGFAMFTNPSGEVVLYVGNEKRLDPVRTVSLVELEAMGRR
jgi:hypothetical protein